jgi:hypothetical protein
LGAIIENKEQINEASFAEANGKKESEYMGWR